MGVSAAAKSTEHWYYKNYTFGENMDNNSQDKPKSLFGDNDIRYSVDTVDQRWGREMARRKKLAAKIAIPALIILISLWLGSAKKYEFFPFQQEIQPMMPPENVEQPPEKPGTPIEKMGYEKADMKFSILFSKEEGKLPDEVMAVFHEATDSKPSRIYAEIWNEENAPDWLKKMLPPGGKYAIGLDDGPIFESMDTVDKIIKVINDTYSITYKDDALVINPATYGFKAPTEEELKERAEKRRRMEEDANLKLPGLKFER